MYRNLVFIFGLGAISFFNAGCSTGVNGETVMGRPGSPAWFNSASPQTIAAHFTEVCKTYGFQPNTPQFADCLKDTINSSRADASRKSAAIMQSIQANQPKTCYSSGSLNGSIYSGSTTCY